MRLAIAFLFATGALSAQGPRLIYTKVFPGSTPAYVSISVEKDGKSEYKEAPDDDRPLKFQLAPEETTEIFGLVEKLERLKRPLESGLKVANMGMKTIRFEDGAEKNEQKFNFTQDLDGRALYDWFEKITETELHVFNLERTVKFDKLGVYKALLQLETARDRKRLVAPEQFLPLLDRVVKNESYVHMARERAAGLAEGIRNPKPKAE